MVNKGFNLLQLLTKITNELLYLIAPLQNYKVSKNSKYTTVFFYSVGIKV